MKPVTMRTMTDASEAYRACLASMLELELDEVPVFVGMASDLQMQAWTASELNLAHFQVQQMRPPPVLWIALVNSPYPAYSVHALVMEGLLIAHDPHPEPQPIDVTGGVLQCDLYVPLNPALPVGKYALHAS